MLLNSFHMIVSPRKHFYILRNVVYEIKGIDYSKMSDKEYDEFLKSAMPKDFEQFKDLIKKAAEETGVEIVRKDDLKSHSEKYAISLHDALNGKDPKKIKDLDEWIFS